MPSCSTRTATRCGCGGWASSRRCATTASPPRWWPRRSRRRSPTTRSRCWPGRSCRAPASSGASTGSSRSAGPRRTSSSGGRRRAATTPLTTRRCATSVRPWPRPCEPVTSWCSPARSVPGRPRSPRVSGRDSACSASCTRSQPAASAGARVTTSTTCSPPSGTVGGPVCSTRATAYAHAATGCGKCGWCGSGLYDVARWWAKTGSGSPTSSQPASSRSSRRAVSARDSPSSRRPPGRNRHPSTDRQTTTRPAGSSATRWNRDTRSSRGAPSRNSRSAFAYSSYRGANSMGYLAAQSVMHRP